MLAVDSIDVVILCGGLGKRLRSVMVDCPKAMVKIDGHPFLDILIGYLAQCGFQRFILCSGYKREFIKKYYQRKKNRLQIKFSEEEEPLGTGGAIKKAQPLIHSNPFLVVNGDSFCQFDALKFLEFHKEKGAVISMAVTESKKSDDYGNVILDGSNQIISFSENLNAEDSQFINAGVYLFQHEVFSLMPWINTFSLEQDFFPKIVGSAFYGYIIKGPLIDIGTSERYQKAKEYLKNDVEKFINQ